MQFKSFMEALKGNQHKLDKNKNGKLDAHDFKLLQKEEDDLEEGIDRVERSDYKVNPSGRKSHKQIDFKNGEPEPTPQREEVELDEAMGVDPISHKTYMKGGVPHSGRKDERHKFTITATVKGRGGKEEKIEQESHAKGTKDEAEAKLRDHFTNRLGYKISSMKHMGTVKEEAELDERTMTDAEMKKREEYVKGMKKNVAGFKAKYGDRAKDVMYATATKMAMKEEEHLDERNKENAIRRKMMDASRGARWKVQNKMTGDDVRDWDGKHKTAQAQNKAIGRALRNEDLDEAKQPDLPFDPPYKKATDNGNIKDKSGATHTPMSQVRHLARQAMKKQMKEAFDLDITDEQADSLVEAANLEQLDELSKGTIGSYIKKAKGSAIGAAQVTGMGSSMTGQKTQDKAERKVQKRAAGINKAVDRLTKEDLDVDVLDEAVESGNKGNGYHGQHDSEVADKKYSAMHTKVKKIAGEAGHLRDAKKPNVMVKHYLDSKHGRHLAGNEHDHEYIKKDFGRFKKAYKPELHEGVDFDEEGNLMSEKLKFSDFIAKINEQLLEYESDDSGVYRHTKKATYGTAYQGDDDEDEKPKKAPAEKRGRGRPAGSYGGSYKARSAETKAAAAAKAAATKAAKKK